MRRGAIGVAPLQIIDMATAFSSLYEFTRTCLGDEHATLQRYADAHLDRAIRFALLTWPDHTEVVEDSSKTITPDLTAKQKGLLGCDATLVMLMSQTTKSIRTPTFSTTRDIHAHACAVRTLRAKIENDGTTTLVAAQTELSAWLNAGTRYSDEVSDALDDT